MGRLARGARDAGAAWRFLLPFLAALWVAEVQLCGAQTLGLVQVPPLLQKGCRPGAGGLKIGMSYTESALGPKAHYAQNLQDALDSLEYAVDLLQGINISLCVKNDENSPDNVLSIYRNFTAEGFHLLLGPTQLGFNRVAERVARESGVRAILWSRDRRDYGKDTLGGDLVFDNRDATQMRLEGERQGSFGGSGWQFDDEKKGRRLQAEYRCDVDSSGNLGEGNSSELPLVLWTQFEPRSYLVSTIAQLRAMASSIVFITVADDSRYQQGRECALLPAFSERLGYNVTQVEFPQDPSEVAKFMHNDDSEIAVFCVSEQKHEFLQSLVKGNTWEPKLLLSSRHRVIEGALQDLPVAFLNYNVEPTLWPDPLELFAMKKMPIFEQYGRWWARHRKTVDSSPPTLMAYQVVAALQIFKQMYQAGYYKSFMDKNDLPVAWEWRREPLETVNGNMRFTEQGCRDPETSSPAIRQLLPWSDQDNTTRAAFIRRYYTSNLPFVVWDMENLRTQFQALVESLDGEKGLQSSLLENHPIATGEGSYIAAAVYPQKSIKDKFLEIYPCRSGCTLVEERCVPCPMGTFRSSRDFACRACLQGRHSDRLGLPQCRDCPPGAFCDDMDRAGEPEALYGWHKVRRPAKEIPQSMNRSSPVWESWCSNWTDVASGTSRTSEDKDPGLDYFFAVCTPRHLCEGRNRCRNFNTGNLCAYCLPGFSQRHKNVDSLDCQACPSNFEVGWQLVQSAAFFVVPTYVILLISHLEHSKMDAVKGPLLLSILMHLQSRGLLLETLANNAFIVSQWAWHVYASMILTRPFDLSFTDCLFNDEDPYSTVRGLLSVSYLSYSVGLLFTFFIGPFYLLLCNLAELLKKVARRKPGSAPTTPESPRSTASGRRTVLSLRKSLTGNSLSLQLKFEKKRLSQAERCYILIYKVIELRHCLLISLKRVLVWTLVFYPVLVRAAASAFFCELADNTAVRFERLHIDKNLECNDPGLNMAKAISFWILVVFGAGFPLVVVVVLHWEKPNFAHIESRKFLGILVCGYKQRFYFWEALKLARNAAVILSRLFQNTLMRTSFVCLIFLVFTFTQMTLGPHARYHRSALPLCEAVSSISFCVMIISTWIENSLATTQKQVVEGGVPYQVIGWTRLGLVQVERYGDVLFFIFATRALLFSLVVLPVHIADRTGANFGRYVKALVWCARQHFGLNSVGLITTLIRREGHEPEKDFFLNLSALTSRELGVMKLGFGEAMHVAVRHYSRFHPMLIIHSLDRAAQRASQARKMISLHRKAEEEHGFYGGCLRRLVVESQANSPTTDRTGSLDSVDMAKLLRAQKELDADGYFTVDELYTAMQDVIVDIVDRHPLLRNVGSHAHQQGLAEREDFTGWDRPRASNRRRSDGEMTEKEIHRLEALGFLDDEALFQKLVLEHQVQVRRDRQQRMEELEHQRALFTDERKGRTGSDADVIAASASEVDEMVTSASRARLFSDTSNWLREAEDLRRVVSERRQNRDDMRRRLLVCQRPAFGPVGIRPLLTEEHVQTGFLSPRARGITSQVERAESSSFVSTLSPLKTQTIADEITSNVAPEELAVQHGLVPVDDDEAPEQPHPHPAPNPPALRSHASAPPQPLPEATPPRPPPEALEEARAPPQPMPETTPPRAPPDSCPDPQAPQETPPVCRALLESPDALMPQSSPEKSPVILSVPATPEVARPPTALITGTSPASSTPPRRRKSVWADVLLGPRPNTIPEDRGVQTPESGVLARTAATSGSSTPLSLPASSEPDQEPVPRRALWASQEARLEAVRQELQRGLPTQRPELPPLNMEAATVRRAKAGRRWQARR